MSRAAQELRMVSATPTKYLFVLMTMGQEWIERGVWFGVHIAFWVLSTDYQLNQVTVSVDGPFEEFTEEDLQLVHNEICPFAKALAARYEEEALPKKVGEN